MGRGGSSEGYRHRHPGQRQDWPGARERCPDWDQVWLVLPFGEALSCQHWGQSHDPSMYKENSPSLWAVGALVVVFFSEICGNY